MSSSKQHPAPVKAPAPAKASAPAKAGVEYSQAAVARYLLGLGYGEMVLPGGLPEQEPELTSDGGVAAQQEQAHPRKPRPSASARPSVARKIDSETQSSSGTESFAPVASFEIATGLDIAGRSQRLDEVCSQALECTACVLSQKRTKVVFGAGDANADLMLIGEGPGAQEDRQGLPFVGPAGELLTKMLKAIDLDRSDVYIANMVKCRPPGNRDPRPEEVVACSSYLEAQVKLVQPRAILALGRVAAQALLQTDSALGRLRNEWHSFQGVPVRVTYHPAALLRNAGYKRPAWEDLQLVRDHLAQPSD